MPLSEQQEGRCGEWRVKEWREGEAVRYNGSSHEEGLTEQGWEGSKQKQDRLRLMLQQLSFG